MNPRPLIFAVRLVVVCITAACPAPALAADPIPAKRGVASSIEVTHAPGRLRARASDANAPLLVRVESLAEDRSRIEFFPLRSGEFDLAPYLERTDGTPAAITSATTLIQVTSQLPPDAGTNIFESSRDPVAIATRYRTALYAIIALWVLVPIIVIVRARLRRPPPPVVAPVVPPPTLLDRVRSTLARGDQLSTNERAELELLLLRHMRSERSGESAAAISHAVSELRTSPGTSELIAHLERWLHAGDEAQRQSALHAVTQYLAQRGGAA